MSKIYINSMLHNKKENKFYSDEVIGIKDNKIKFITDKVMNILDINNDVINLKRKSDEYEIDMTFDKNTKTKGTYYIKTLGYLNLEIVTNKIIIKDNYIEIDYIMYLENEKTNFIYKLDWRSYDK